MFCKLGRSNRTSQPKQTLNSTTHTYTVLSAENNNQTSNVRLLHFDTIYYKASNNICQEYGNYHP